MTPREFIFVCTGNSCRSPLAEYMFRAKLAARLDVAAADLASAGYVVASAGTHAPEGGPISRGSLNELRRRGIDASEHRAQRVTADMLARAERVFVMTEDHRDLLLAAQSAADSKVELLAPGEAVADPIGGDEAAYRACADQIERLVERRVEELLG